MNLKALRIFLAVLEAGSLSGAARTLGISQPAISKQLQSLEEELGAELVLRGHRGVIQVTPAGRMLQDFARATLTQYEGLLSALRALQSQEAGILYLAASTTPGHFILPGLLKRFQNHHAGVHTHLSITNSAGVLEQLRSNHCDIGFVGNPVNDAGLVSIPFIEDAVVLALPADHPLAGRDRITLEELFAQKLILREPGSGTRAIIESQLSPADKERLHQSAILELGSTHAVLAAVAAGAGVGFVSQHALQERGRGDVVASRVEGVNGRRQLYIVYPQHKAHWPPLRTFVEFLLAETSGAKAP